MKKIYDKNGNLFAELNYSKEYYLNYSKHSHETFGLSIIGDGGLEIEFHGKEKKYLYKNKIVIFNPNEVHMTKSKIVNTRNYYNLHVNTNWCKNKQTELFGLKNKFIEIKENIITEKDTYDELYKIFKNIILNNNINSEKLEQLLIYILKNHTNLEDNSKYEFKNILLEKVEKYILNNIDNQISLEDISWEVGYNEAYITRIFKKKFGLSPHAFLINKRIEKAKRKLLNSKNINISQLSHEVGFYDQSHFTRGFKRVYAMTPNQYKNNRK